VSVDEGVGVGVSEIIIVGHANAWTLLMHVFTPCTLLNYVTNL